MFAHKNWHRRLWLHSPFSISLRSFASDKKIVQYRSIQKQIFGAVIKPTKKKRAGNLDKASLSGESSSIANELYWTARHSQLKQSHSSPAKSTPATQAIESPNKPTPAIQAIEIPQKTQQHQVLVDNNELNAIAKYSIYGPKAQYDQMQQLLDNSDIRLPSISRILQATMSDGARAALKKWKQSKINELGYAGFQLYQRDIFETGKQFHMTIEQYLANGKIPDSNSPIINLWNSVNGHLVDLKPQAVLIEKPLVHTQLKYQGIVDNVSIVG